MFWNGPISSIFDWVTFALLYFVFCPKFVSSGLTYNKISQEALVQSGIFSGIKNIYVSTFQTGWLIECIWTQIIITFILRTKKIPFVESNPSKFVVLLAILSAGFITLIPFTIGSLLGLTPIPFEYFCWLSSILAAYVICASVMKIIYIKVNKSWL
jgi:Mg2+-importing ATPase